MVCVHNGIAITRNIFGSVLMRWMNLEPIIQSEMSQKEKDKYHILMHIHGILNYHMLKDSQREFAVWLRKLKQGLCINLER